MPGNLPDGVVIVLEQVAHLRPFVEQPANPGPRDQADRRLDTACPVHAAQERVGTPPGAQLRRGRLGVSLVLRQPPGGGQDGEVMMPRHLPDLLDVAGFRLVPVVDAECQPGRRARGARSPDRENQSGSALSARRIPSTVHVPARTVSAAWMSAEAASGSTSVRADVGSDDAKARSFRVSRGSGAVSPGWTWRRAQMRRRPASRVR